MSAAIWRRTPWSVQGLKSISIVIQYYQIGPAILDYLLLRSPSDALTPEFTREWDTLSLALYPSIALQKSEFSLD